MGVDFPEPTWKPFLIELISVAEETDDLDKDAQSFSLTKYTGKEVTSIRDLVHFFELEHYLKREI
jgi:hypothetical protein